MCECLEYGRYFPFVTTARASRDKARDFNLLKWMKASRVVWRGVARGTAENLNALYGIAWATKYGRTAMLKIPNCEHLHVRSIKFTHSLRVHCGFQRFPPFWAYNGITLMVKHQCYTITVIKKLAHCPWVFDKIRVSVPVIQASFKRATTASDKLIGSQHYRRHKTT